MTEKSSLANSFLEALGMPGGVFHHYKGGVYRVLEVQGGVVKFEHLWPHPHDVHRKTEDEFFGRTDNGALRFYPVNKEAQAIHPEIGKKK